MNIDYKFWYVTRDDSGEITEAAIRFYEGEEKDVSWKDLATGKDKTKRRYVRAKRLSKDDVPELDGLGRHDTEGFWARVYRPEHFGKIKSDDELRLFLNRQIAKHKGRMPHKDQSETEDISKVK